jgi:hypothetical protein
MISPTYFLSVHRPVPFMKSLVEAFCGDAHLSLEGDLSNLRWTGRLLPNPRIGVLLQRHTFWPKQDYAILPLEEGTLVEIKESVLPVVGLAEQVIHVQIEQHRELVFGAYDEFCEFCDGCVWVNSRVGQEFLDRLKEDGCLRSYEPSSIMADERTDRLAKLLTERDISLEEALQTFGADGHRALEVLTRYLSMGDAVLKDGDEILDGRRVRLLLGDPGRLEIEGALRLCPVPIDAKAQEHGQEDDLDEWMAIVAKLRQPAADRDTKPV